MVDNNTLQGVEPGTTKSNTTITTKDSQKIWEEFAKKKRELLDKNKNVVMENNARLVASITGEKEEDVKNGHFTKKNSYTKAVLVMAFTMDCTVDEACAMAQISKQTYYNWYNSDKKFAEAMEMAKHWNMILARSVVTQALINNDSKIAMDVITKRDARYSNQWEWDVVVTMNKSFVDMMRSVANSRIKKIDRENVIDMSDTIENSIEDDEENLILEEQ